MRFVLVHGGFHGAWCWSRAIPELERLGHQAIAIDLPGHGTRRDERSTIADRRDAIAEVVEAGDVLVGHSGGGYDITFAADMVPELVRHVCYLAAGLPFEGRTVLEATGGATELNEKGEEVVVRPKSDDTGLGMSRFIKVNERGRIECVDFELVREYFYHDCDEQTARWAFDLLTPAPVEFLVERVSVPHFWEAELPRSYVWCLQDRAKEHEKSESCVERLGVTPLTIDTSHSPFLSRPRDLAELLVAAVGTKPIGPLRPT